MTVISNDLCPKGSPVGCGWAAPWHQVLLIVVSNGLGPDGKLSRITLRSGLKEDREKFEHVYRKFLPNKGEIVECLFGICTKQFTWWEVVRHLWVLHRNNMNDAVCHAGLCNWGKESILDLLEIWEPTERCYGICNVINVMNRNFLCWHVWDKTVFVTVKIIQMLHKNLDEKLSV